MSRWRSWSAFLLCLPALLLLGLVLHYRVDVPWADVWDTPGRLFENLLLGKLSAADFFWQHNESRKLFPRLFYLATAAMGGLHTLPGILLQWALLAGTFALLASWSAVRDSAHWLVLFAMALLIFTPAQSENATWDIQFIVIVPVFCVVLAARLNATDRPERSKFLLSAALALVATYTFANGMICWLLCAPGWWRLAPGAADRRGLTRWDLAYLAVAVFALAGYFAGYVKPPQHPALNQAARDPLAALTFFLAWIGGPWSQALSERLPSAVLIGSCLLLGAGILTATALRRWQSLPREALGWMLLLAYGLTAGMATMIGRLGLGQIFALPPRYVPLALWIPVAALGLWRCLAAERSAPLTATAGALGLLALLSWPPGVAGLAERQQTYEQGQLSLRAIELIPDDPLLLRVHPDRESLQRRARLFAERGWLDLPLLRPASLGAPASQDGGWYHVRSEGNRVHLDGWTMLPGPTREAPYLLAGYRQPDGTVKLVTAIRPVLRRPEIGRAMQAPGLVKCGFDVTFDLPDAPANDRWVLAAIEEVNGQAHQLRWQK